MFQFGFAQHIWEEAISFDSLSLNNLLVIMVLFAYMHFVNARRETSDRKRLSSIKLISLLSGLSLCNQHQSVLSRL